MPENRKPSRSFPMIIKNIFSSKLGRFAFTFFFGSYLLLVFRYSGILELERIELNTGSLTNIIIVITLTLSISLFILSYLEGAFEKTIQRPIRNIVNDRQIGGEKHEDSDLINVEGARIHVNFSHDDELGAEIKEALKAHADKEFFESLKVHISEGITSAKKDQLLEVSKLSNSIKSRLKNEISKLDRTSNVNLLFGSLLTVTALIGLLLIVFETHDQLNTMEKILSHYIPRISFIVFIEVFAFFFLRLYKLNLNDIKYYQNELTNVDLKSISLISAINFGVESDTSAVLGELSKTERNFVIEKGQSTIDLEKFKHSEASLERMLKIFKDTIKIK